MKFAFDGQFKDSDNKVKVSCILNWLGDEAFLIYDNLTFEEPAHKDLPDKVLKAFSSYLKPERNVFHSWYTLGSIYSNQFKSQSDFYNHLQCIAKECNFSSHDQVVKFLFLTHNNNTHVCEDLLQEMKEDTTLSTMLNIAHISEGTIHSEELSKQYLEMIKVSKKPADSVKKSRSKSGGRKSARSTSHGGSCSNCGSKHPPCKCKAFGKKCYSCGKMNHFITMCRSRNRSQSQHKRDNSSVHIVPINLLVISRIMLNRTDLIMTSMKLIIKVIHMTMNKIQLPLCSICSSETRTCDV